MKNVNNQLSFSQKQSAIQLQALKWNIIKIKFEWRKLKPLNILMGAKQSEESQFPKQHWKCKWKKKLLFSNKIYKPSFSRATDVVCVYIYIFFSFYPLQLLSHTIKVYVLVFIFFSSVSLFSVETGYETITVNERSFS